MGTAAASILAAAGPIAHPARAGADDAKRERAGVVQTALGPIEARNLGFTLTHEHVGSSAAKTCGSRANSVARAVDKLKEARDAGISAVIDVTTFETGRDIRFCEEISRKSGSDDAADMDYLVGLVKRGYTLGMDYIHRGNRPGALLPGKSARHVSSASSTRDSSIGFFFRPTGCSAMQKGKGRTRMGCCSTPAGRSRI